MKQYIKAAYDSSMPDWLKVSADGSVDNSVALNYLKNTYAMGTAKFYSEPQPDSITIYLLYNTYTELNSWNGKYKSENPPLVYIPDISFAYDDIWLSTGERYRRLETATKARFEELIVDTTYMVAQPRSEARETRTYVDPRYIDYNNSGKWRYAGQVPEYNSEWDPKQHKYVPNKTQAPRRYRKAGEGYDKSGYKIPTPEELYNRLYEKIPDKTKASVDRVKSIIETYYQKLNKAKKKIFSGYDIRKGKTVFVGYGSPLDDLNSAISHYYEMCQRFNNCFDKEGTIDPKELADFMSGQDYDSLNYSTRQIDNRLQNIERKLQNRDD